MRASRFFSVLLLSISWILSAQQLARCEDAELGQEVKGVLVEGWKGKTGTIAAQSHFEKAKELGPQDVRPTYSWGLVQIKSQSFKDAVQTFDLLVQDHADKIGPRVTQIWLHAEEQEYKEMLTGVMALAMRLPKENAKEPPQEEEKDAAKFLGHLFGYFAGPGAGRVPDGKFDQREKLITAQLHPTLRADFDAAREETLKKFADSQDNKPKDANSTTAFDTPAVGTVNVPNSTDPQATALKDKYMVDRSALEKKLAELKVEYEKLAKQGEALAAKVRQTQAEEQAKSNEAKRAKGTQASALKNAAANLAKQVVKEEGDYGKLNDQATKIKEQGSEIQKQLSHLANQYRADLSRVASSKTGTDTRTGADKSGSATSLFGDSINDPLTALEGYLPFAIDVHRNRIVDSFHK